MVTNLLCLMGEVGAVPNSAENRAWAWGDHPKAPGPGRAAQGRAVAPAALMQAVLMQTRGFFSLWSGCSHLKEGFI